MKKSCELWMITDNEFMSSANWQDRTMFHRVGDVSFEIQSYVERFGYPINFERNFYPSVRNSGNFMYLYNKIFQERER